MSMSSKSDASMDEEEEEEEEEEKGWVPLSERAEWAEQSVPQDDGPHAWNQRYFVIKICQQVQEGEHKFLG